MKPDELAKLNEIYEFMQALKSSTTVPFEVDTAFRERFSDVAGLIVSNKGADSEDVTVNEAGASSYAVMNDPDGFLQVEIGGATYHVPYFT